MNFNDKEITIAVCITAFNRRDKTIAALNQIRTSTIPSNVRIKVFLLDDGSTDGTSAAIIKHHPNVHLFQGDGDYFWAGGMRVVYQAAMDEGHDFYIWMNDDVQLELDAFTRALQAYSDVVEKCGGNHIIVGAMRIPGTNDPSYGGFKRKSAVMPWKFRSIPPLPDRPQECDTINGNFVLIPHQVAVKLGGIPKAYRQMHADIDLGLTARRAGFRCWIAPGFLGACAPNLTGRKNWNQSGISLAEQLKIMEHPLGYPIVPSIAFAIRNFLPWAPAMIAAPYISLIWARFKNVFGRPLIHAPGRHSK